MPAEDLWRVAATRFKDELRAGCDGCDLEVRAFGSRPRGDAEEDSDLDLLVLADEEDPEVERQLFRVAREVSAELGYPFYISPHLMARSHFEELVRRERLFAREVLRDGVVL